MQKKWNMQEVEAFVHTSLAQELELEVLDKGVNTLADLGLDSISCVTWVRKINSRFGCSLQASDVYSYPTLEQFTRFVISQLHSGLPQASTAPLTPSPEQASLSDEPLAVGVVEALRTLVCRELDLEPQAISVETSFVDLGLDSISGVTLIRRINSAYGLALSAAAVYDHPTLRQLADLIEARRSPEVNEPQAAQPAPGPKAERQGLASLRRRAPASLPVVDATSEAQHCATDIAIVGMAGRFPKAANLTQFWENLRTGRDCVSPIPAERWSLNDYFDEKPGQRGRTYCRDMGVLESVDQWDPLFFNVSPQEAESMDPQQRLLLQVGWECIENAGYDPHDFAGRDVSFYVGCAPSDYGVPVTDQRYSAQMCLGKDSAIMSSRLSYLLDLRGRTMSIDTACSSSLTALVTACDSLVAQGGTALVAGVWIIPGPSVHIAMSQLRALSPSGRCHAFDAQADGFVPGEGVGVILVKRLQDALDDGDEIQAVIKGWGSNQDGKSNGITAPNGRAQSELIESVYARFGLQPQSIGLIEAHGTGTRLGDPIEVEALKHVFRDVAPETHCALNSVKSNIGHLAPAAGIAGVIKAVLALRHREIPPVANFTELNAHLELEGSPFYVPTSLGNWPAAGKRRAAVSSFGYSGTNAHVVFEEYAQHTRELPDKAMQPCPVVLSARSPEQLTDYAQRLLEYLIQHPGTDLHRMALTLCRGRSVFKNRLLVLADSYVDLKEKLQAVTQRATSGLSGIYLHLEGGTAPQEIDSKVYAAWLQQGKREGLLSSFDTRLPRMAGLPTYPFASQTCWVRSDMGGAKAEPITPGSILREVFSSGEQVRFVSRFDGSEPYLNDHQFLNVPLLPGVSYLEIALQASKRAMEQASAVLAPMTLTEVNWLRPLHVEKPQAIEVVIEKQKSGSCLFSINCLETQQLLCRGGAQRAELAASERNLEDLASLFVDSNIRPDDLYGQFEAAGLHYGSSHRVLRSIAQRHGASGVEAVFARLDVSLPLTEAQSDCLFHHGLADGMLQALIGFQLEPSAEAPTLALPFRAEQFDYLARPGHSLWVLIEKVTGAAPGYPISYDIRAFNDDGGECLRVLGFSNRPVAPQSQQSAQILHYEHCWLPSELPVPVDSRAERARHVVLLGEKLRLLVEPLQQSGYRVSLLEMAQPLSSFGALAQQLVRTGQEVLAQRAPSCWQIVFEESVGDQADLLYALAGLVHSTVMENPQLATQLVGVTSGWRGPELVEKLLSELNGPMHRVVRLSKEGRQIRHLVPVNLSTGEGAPFKHDGIFLITGGNGQLGQVLASKLIGGTSSAQIILCGRNAFDTLNLPISESERKRVHYRRCDIAEPQQCRELIDGIVAEFGVLNGVFHAAGTLQDSLLRNKQPEHLMKVFAPKVEGLVTLDQATAHLPLDFLLCFSSISGSFGGPGQVDYAMANGFMDAFVCWRNEQRRHGRRQGKSISIAWPLWDGGGMRASAMQQQMLASMGMKPLPLAEGFDCMTELLRSERAFTGVLHGDVARLNELVQQFNQFEQRAEFVAAPMAAPRTAEQVERYFAQLLARHLKVRVDQLSPDAPFEKFGLDSVMVMELTDRLEQDFGPLPKTLFFEYQSVRELSAYFLREQAAGLQRLLEPTPGPASPTPLPAAMPVATMAFTPLTRAVSRGPVMAVDDDEIAIIGLSGRYPQADSLAQFWENLQQGKDCISEIPLERWDHRGHYDPDKNAVGKSYSKWGGFMDGVYDFDPLFFNISPREAELMDPQERLFLQCAYETLEDAGYTRAQLAAPRGESPGGQVGVFVGVMYEEYQLYGAQAQQAGQPIALGGSAATIANRVSHLFNFHGLSLALDTMCSSSLTALHLACQSIRLGQCDAALAGGVNVSLHPNKYLMLSQGKFASSQGRCESFGQGGDGYVPGEGVGAVLLKRKRQAIADGDHIYAIIKGSAVNHGGRSNGYSVPSPVAQGDVIHQALNAAGVSAAQISYIEAHGTGTALGDPIEIAGLNRVFGEAEAQRCALGSVKSNIGHCESAAGIAGLTKLLLQLKHQTLVPSLHSSTLNPFIDFDRTPFTVQQTLEPWTVEGNRLRYAGLSSFGAGGSNAHVILEEYRAPASEHNMLPGPQLVVLSAASESQLQQQVSNLLACIEREGYGDEHLARIAFTLQTGREALEWRLGVIAHDMQTLRQALKEDGSDLRICGRIDTANPLLALLATPEESSTFVSSWLQQGQYHKVLEFWLCGAVVDWSQIYAGRTQPLRISLPTYPFLKDRCRATFTAGSESRGQASWLTPLIQRNVSNAYGLAFQSRFEAGGEQSRDHIVHGRELLPGTAQLEMARFAATTLADYNGALTIRDFSWLAPIDTEQALEVRTQVEYKDMRTAKVSIVGSDGQLYSQGQVCLGLEAAQPTLDLLALRQQFLAPAIDGERLYEVLANHGFGYGLSHRCIEEVFFLAGDADKPQVLGRLRHGTSMHSQAAGWAPGLFDSALQVALVLGLEGDLNSDVSNGLAVPFVLGELQSWQALAGETWVHAGYAEGNNPESGLRKLDITLMDGEGRVLMRLSDLNARLLDFANKGLDERSLLFTSELLQRPLEPVDRRTSGEVRHLLLLGELKSQQELVSRALPQVEVLCLPEISQALPRIYEGMLHIIRDAVLQATQAQSSERLLQVVMPGDAGEDSALGGVVSLLRTLTQEVAGLSVQLIEVPAHLTGGELVDIVQEEAHSRRDEHVCYQDDRRVWGLRELPSRPQKGGWKAKGVYLITGGMGGLGYAYAKHIANTVENAAVVLVGRSPVDTAIQHKLDELMARGARACYLTVDLGEHSQVAALLQQIRERFGALDGILHSAGVVQDGLLLSKSNNVINKVLRPKVDGLYWLDQLTADEPLDFFVAFSSLTSVLGNPGQGDYAAANGFLDAYMRHRQRQVQLGLRSGQSLSISWPLWAGGGMDVSDSVRRLLARRGIVALPPEQGLDLLQECLATGQTHIAVAYGHPQLLRHLFGHGGESEASPSASQDVVTAVPIRSSVVTPNLPVSAGRSEPTENYLLGHLSSVLKVERARIDVNLHMDQYGLDSVMVMELTDRLEQDFGPLPKTLFFEYQSVRELSAYFLREQAAGLQRLLEPTPGPASPTPLPAAMPVATMAFTPLTRAVSRGPVMAVDDDEIAIIGLSGRYPQADSLAQFWENLQQGKDCISEIPLERWDHRGHYDPDKNAVGKSYSKWGGFMDGVYDFDPLFFNISPREAELMDPQERLFLQCAYETLEDAGYTRAQLAAPRGESPGGQVGVFVGVMYEEYQLYGAQAQQAGQPIALGGSAATIANRVSHLFNFHGLSLALDTMCSSSLTALHLACQSIRLGQCDAALAGGVNVSLHPNKYLMLSQGKFASSQGRCESFGQGGDGYVPGEGVGAVLLKRKRQAIADGDHIYAIIKGSAVNHGGRSNGYSVPSPVAQGDVIHQALNAAGVSAAQISYIEAHGTGTALGDPIEIAGLNRVFGEAEAQRCALGSVKSNIGHCESAAGIAGLTKLLLQLKHQTLVPSLHSSTLNPFIDFDRTPFTVQQTLEPWTVEGNRLRYAGLSSFGAGGSNAHVILEEYRAPASEHNMLPGPQLVVLSAASESQLQQQVSNLLACIEREGYGDEHLARIAFTLQTGREALEWRLGVIAHDMQTLRSQLRAAFTREPSEQVMRSQVRKHTNQFRYEEQELDMLMTAWLAQDRPQRLLQAWMGGQAVNWSKLYEGLVQPRRISLPTYPFLRTLYRVGGTRPDITSSSTATLALVPQWKTLVLGAPPLNDGVPCVVAVGISGAEKEQLASLNPVLVLDAESESFTALTVQLMHYFQSTGNPEQPTLLQVVVGRESASAVAEGLWSMLKSTMLELDRIEAQLIQLCSAQSTDAATFVMQCRSLGSGYFRSTSKGQLQQQDWKEILLSPAVAKPWREGGVYLITGGLGGLSRLLLEDISQAVEHAVVILTGRTSKPVATQRTPLPHIAGLQIEYLSLDVTDAVAVQALIADILTRHGELSGVLHLAGITHDSYLMDKSVEQVHAVLAPKVMGVRHLDAATAHLPLELFVAFSSVSSVSGNPGQFDYATANGFLDGFIAQRSLQVAQGLRRGRSLSVNWPLWEAGGMQLEPALMAEMRKRFGSMALPVASGLACFHQAYEAAFARIAFLTGDIELLRSNLLPLINRQGSTRAVPAPKQIASQKLQGLRGWLLECMARLLKMQVADLDIDSEFSDYGFDSVLFSVFVSEINQAFGLELSSATLVGYTTLARLEAFLSQQAASALYSSTSTLDKPSQVDRPENSSKGSERALGATDVSDTDVAIIGMSIRLPNIADDEAFWELLCREGSILGQDQGEIWESRGSRLEAQSYRWGSLFTDVGQFDPGLFGISEQEAVLIDPQERHALMACWQAMLDAGYNREQLASGEGERNVGVYVGVTRPSYNLVGIEKRLHGQETFTGVSFASIANRISHVLNLTGPSMPVDTMCSSSHLALSLACESLIRGETHMAFAGGVNIYSHPSVLADADRLKLLSDRSQHESFGTRGTGFVPAEAVGVVLLKPLRRALEDGDQIYAVIKGTAQRHSGRSMGYFSANPRGQAQVMQAALDRAGVTADEIDYLEAQGSGSRVSDAVEAAAIEQVYAKAPRARELRVGCVKSNVGHAESASGMTQLFKVILQLRKAWFLPTRLPSTLNPDIAWRAGQVAIQSVGAAWDTKVRRAAINGFGAGGVSVHLVIEQAPEVKGKGRGHSVHPTLVPISARSSEALRDYALRLEQHLACEVDDSPESLRDVAFTLAQGRERYACRSVLVADDINGVRAQLANLVAGHAYQPSPYEEANAVIAQWQEGNEVAWVRDGWIEPGQRLSLPIPAMALHDCWPANTLAVATSMPDLENIPDERMHSVSLKSLPGIGLQQQMIAMSSLMLLRFCQAHQVFISSDTWSVSALQSELGWAQRLRLLRFVTSMMQAAGMLEQVAGGWRATRVALSAETQRSIEYFAERVQMLGRAMPTLHRSMQLLDQLWLPPTRPVCLTQAESSLEEGRTAVIAGNNLLAQGMGPLIEQVMAIHRTDPAKPLSILELGNTSLGLVRMILEAVGDAGTTLRVEHCATSDELRVLRERVAVEQLPEVEYTTRSWDRLEACLQQPYDLFLVSASCLDGAAELLTRLAERRELLIVHDAFDQPLVSMMFGLTDESVVEPRVGAGISTSLPAVFEQQGMDVCVEFMPRMLLVSAGSAGNSRKSSDEVSAVLACILRVFNNTFSRDSEVLAHTDLRDMAATSLELAVVFAELSQVYGDAISHSDIFSCFTPRDLAERVCELRAESRDQGFSQAVVEAYRKVGHLPAVPTLCGDQLLSAHQFISSQGITLEYFCGGEGEPLLFLTALAFTKAIWEEQIKALHSQHLLIFPHLPGHAGSHFSGQRFSFQDLANALTELLDHLKLPKVHLVGWCMAGNIAQLMALEHGDRLASLTLVCTTPTDVRARGLSAADLHAYSADPLQTYELEFANVYPARADRNRVGHYLSLIQHAHTVVEAGAMIYLFAGLSTFDTQQRLHQIQVPTLIFAGERDIAFPVEQVELLKRIPHARFVRMKESGHMPFLNQAPLFNRELLAFIEHLREPLGQQASALEDG